MPTAGIAETEAARRRRPLPSPTRGHGEYLQRPEHARLGRDEFDAAVQEQAARGYGRFDELSQQLHKMVVGLAGEAPEDSQSFLDVPLMASVRRARETSTYPVKDPLTARSALRTLGEIAVPREGWEHIVDRTPLRFLKYLPAGAFGVGKLPSRQKQWYHGTPETFEEFKSPAERLSTPPVITGSGPRMGDKSPDRLKRPAHPYFASEDPDLAGRFAGRAAGAQMRPVRIEAENIFDFRKPEHRKIIADRGGFKVGGVLPDGSWVLEGQMKTGYWVSMERDDIQKIIRDSGFDGFLVKETPDPLAPLNIGIYDAKKHMRPVWEGATDAAQREIDFPSDPSTWKHAPSDWYKEYPEKGLGPPPKSHTLSDLEKQVGKQAGKVFMKKKPRGIVPKMSLEEIAKRQEEMESIFSFINPKKNP